MCWFAAAYLLRETEKTRWEQVDAPDVRRWMVWLLDRYSGVYAHQQYRALLIFFRWLAVEGPDRQDHPRSRPSA